MKKLFTSLTLILLLLPAVSFAQNYYNVGGGGSTSGACQGSGGIFQICNPLNVGTICGLIRRLLSVFLAIGAPVAVLFLVYAGFMFVVARGNPKELETAKRNLGHVLLGIAIFLGAWMLGQVIANTINAISPGTVDTTASCN